MSKDFWKNYLINEIVKVAGEVARKSEDDLISSLGYLAQGVRSCPSCRDFHFEADITCEKCRLRETMGDICDY